ncbi:unnamed protein product [Durusdinium trenchii]|uniref:Uncharacterized protein n=1 Tax=Durusdinium trenchii TaxID=1381693 RepID=A0ABP0QDB1_9DINO
MPSFQGRQICLLALPVGDLKINDVSDGHIIREVGHGAEDVRKAGNFACKAKEIVVEGPIKQDWILARMDLQKAVEEVMHLDRQTVKNLAENAKKGMDSFHGDQKLREAVKRLEGHLRSRTTKMPPYPQAGALYIPTDDGESPFQERLGGPMCFPSWPLFELESAGTRQQLPLPYQIQRTKGPDSESSNPGMHQNTTN